MNVLHHHLEAIEAASFRNLDLSGEALCQVLQNNSIRGSEEGQYMVDKVLLILLERLPVLTVLVKVNLVYSPETGHLILVHLPNVMILDG